MTHYILRCGCGFKTKVRSLTKEASCSNCGWQLVWQERKRAFYVSQHAMVHAVTTPRQGADGGKR